MTLLIDYIETEFLKDPVVFAWINARQRSNWNDEEALKNLVESLISNKNMAFKYIDKLNTKGKVLEFKK